MKKTDKEYFVENLGKKLKDTETVFIVNYSGLGVAQQRELKKSLREAGARFQVVKNTLFKRAAESAKLPSDITSDTVLTGQNGLVTTNEDPIKALSAIIKFASENEHPEIKVGLVEGTFQEKDDLTRLSKLGSRESVVAGVIGVMMAPTYQMVGVLEGNLQSLIYILDTASKKS